MARAVDADRFASELSGLLDDIYASASGATSEGVKDGLKAGAREWRRNARKAFGTHRYKRHGRWYNAGRYARSVRWHMRLDAGTVRSGEIGSPKMPGLPHLLENGHARVGGGRVEGVEHIAPAADVAFDTAYRSISERIGDAL